MSDLGLREQLVPDVFEVLPASVYQGPAVLKSRRSPQSNGSNAASPGRWLIGVAGVAGLSVWLYVVSVHANSAFVNSDGATVILQGKEVASGNIALHGWNLSLDSWWTLDVPFYALATALVGVKRELLFAIPATIAAMVVVVGVVMARRGQGGAAALLGSATVFALLGLPTHAYAYYFVSQPLHVSTTLYALVAFLGLRNGRFGWGWWLSVVLLAAGLLGDLQMASYGVVPVLLAGLVAMRRRRSWRAGWPAVVSAACSVVLAIGVRRLVESLGGFTIGATNRPASLHQMWPNLVHVPIALAQLIGIVDTSQGTGGVPLVLEAVHVVVAPLLILCFFAVVVRMIEGLLRGEQGAQGSGTSAGYELEPWRLDDLLALGTLGCLFNFVYLSHTASGFLRYLTAAVVFMSIIAGREVTRWGRGSSGRWLATANAVAAVTLSCFLAACGLEVTSPLYDQPVTGLVAYLETHHLYSGVGDFWAASITTVWSEGKVHVRPLVASADGVLEAFNRGETPGWFAGQRFRFVVYPTSTAANVTNGVSFVTATKTWGRPARADLVSGYVVLSWSRPIEVTRYEPLKQPF
jgi:hypothetical protein